MEEHSLHQGSGVMRVRANRRTVLRGVGAGATLAMTAGGARLAAASQGTSSGDSEHRVYYGSLLGAAEIAAVALDVRPAETEGAWDVRAYVCDGLGLPAGLAVWFRGDVDQATVDEIGGDVSLTSPTGAETITIGFLTEHAVTGWFEDANGLVRRFLAYPATAGAGIYDVTLDENLHYRGESTDGSILDAEADEAGRVVGTITTAAGDEIPFDISALALLPEERLATVGLPASFRDYAENSVVPDAYTAVLSPGGLMWLGRSGDIRAGSPGNNIIGLDCCD